MIYDLKGKVRVPVATAFSEFHHQRVVIDLAQGGELVLDATAGGGPGALLDALRPGRSVRVVVLTGHPGQLSGRGAAERGCVLDVVA